MISRTIALAIATLEIPFAARAQTAIELTNSNAVQSGDMLNPEHALGDWGGFRSRLSDSGVDLAVDYTAEIADVTSGGQRHGLDYAHQIRLEATVDGERLLGWRGWSLHARLLQRAGRNASADYLGDDLDQIQEIYGSTGHAAAHLGQFYLEHSAGDDVTLDEHFGRISAGIDFAASPIYCRFITLGICPQPRGLSLASGFTIDPSATWGGRIKAATPFLYLQAGTYQVRPRFGGPSGFDWGFSNTAGVLLPLEAGWTPRLGPNELQGHYKVGVTYDSSDYQDVNPAGPTHPRHIQLYALFDQMLMRTGKSGLDGVFVFGGWTHGDPSTSIFGDYVFAGLSATGLIASRSVDTMQMLVSHGVISKALTNAQRAAIAAGETLPTGFPAAPGGFLAAASAPGVQTNETIIEINYGLHAHDGVVLTPDIQFVGRPGGARTIPDALVLAARVELDF